MGRSGRAAPLLALSFGLSAAIGLALLHSLRAEATRLRARADQLVLFKGVAPERAFDLAARGDAIRDRLHEDGVQYVGPEILRRIQAEPVTDAEARAWYDAHPEVFGDRPFEHCRQGIQQILQVRQARERLESEAGLSPGRGPG